MEYFVVYLIKNKRYLALPMNWIQNPILGQESKVFFSADINVAPDFSLEIGYYLNKNVNACYESYVYKCFDSFDSAQKFAEDKRVTVPIQYKTLKKFNHIWAEPNPVDFLEI